MHGLREYIRNLILESQQSDIIPPPPKDSLEELQYVIRQHGNRYNPEALQYNLDEKMETLFNDIIEPRTGSNVTDYIIELKKQPRDIVSYLKKLFARARPEDVAAKFGIDWKSDSDSMETINNSYSYPSGHAAQAYYVAYSLAEQYPSLQRDLLSVAENVAQSRIDRGVHFPSDLDAGRIVAQFLYQSNKSNISKPRSRETDGVIECMNIEH